MLGAQRTAAAPATLDRGACVTRARCACGGAEGEGEEKENGDTTHRRARAVISHSPVHRAASRRAAAACARAHAAHAARRKPSLLAPSDQCPPSPLRPCAKRNSRVSTRMQMSAECTLARARAQNCPPRSAPRSAPRRRARPTRAPPAQRGPAPQAQPHLIREKRIRANKETYFRSDERKTRKHAKQAQMRRAARAHPRAWTHLRAARRWPWSCAPRAA
jgi:hypothetical protein